MDGHCETNLTMERSAKVTLPTINRKDGKPQAVVLPVVCPAESSLSELDESSTDLMETTSSDTSQSAGQPSVVAEEPTPPLIRSRWPVRQTTVPVTPNVLKWSPMIFWKPKSTEEQELAKIAELQKETAAHIKRNRRMMVYAIAGRGCQHSQRNPSSRRLTTNQPNGRTLSREPRLDPVYREFNFAQELRKYPPSTYFFQGCTVPKPFKLSGQWIQRNDMGTPFVPMAEFINRFEYRTRGSAQDKHRFQEQNRFRNDKIGKRWTVQRCF
ncbi:targeting protein for Xklp2-like [Chiloscyllium punctatum]|uniref:targeting protein for Xklp2-like n=1 Tax=Chiloscyllium punctatum TaxID=137246 RepID=UPI003B635EBA